MVLQGTKAQSLQALKGLRLRSAMPGARSGWLKSQDSNTIHRDRGNYNIRDFITEIEGGTKSETNITTTCQLLEKEVG